MMHTLNAPGFFVAASPAEREGQDLTRRAVADFTAGRPLQSEHYTYFNAYEGARLLAAVDSGDLIVIDSEYRDMHGAGCLGVLGLSGVGSTQEVAEFIDIAHLRAAVARGVHLIDEAGDDVTHLAFSVQ